MRNHTKPKRPIPLDRRRAPRPPQAEIDAYVLKGRTGRVKMSLVQLERMKPGVTLVDIREAAQRVCPEVGAEMKEKARPHNLARGRAFYE